MRNWLVLEKNQKSQWENVRFEENLKELLTANFKSTSIANDAM